ncbi:MAG: cbb3-type cytochrome oxidase assembly protein CcoS [Verrucomicrobiales bacterium]|nr:cbb3-type cytochrome oxidase assembly protein CcoS [Verrucomicrobiales bacterium]
MSVLLILILASLAVALLFLGGFVWAVRSGQFEDTITPSMRVLTEETTRSARGPAGEPDRALDPRESGARAAPHSGWRAGPSSGAATPAKG